MTDSSSREELVELAEKLSPDEKALLLGECSGWGSWMFDAGEYLVSLGLGTKRNGSIYFDTPLAKSLTDFLQASTLTANQEKPEERSRSVVGGD